METRAYLVAVLVLLFWLAPKPASLQVMPAQSEAAPVLRSPPTRTHVVRSTPANNDPSAGSSRVISTVAPEMNETLPQ